MPSSLLIAMCFREYKKMRNFTGLISTFLRSKKKYSPPPKADVLLFDNLGSEFLPELFDGKTCSIFERRGLEVNVICLIFSCLQRAFWKREFFVSYLDAYISFTKPYLILTFLDNDRRFLEISSRWPNIKTALIQNGYRRGPFDLFGTNLQNKHLKVDQMFTFSAAFKKKYQTLIKGQATSIGSFRNNHHVAHSIKKKILSENTVLFVSQFFEKITNDERIITPTVSIDYQTNWIPEKTVLSFLQGWCEANEFQLQILARSQKNLEVERQFFNTLVGSKPFDLIAGKVPGDQYYLLDQASIVVFIDSSLGYESMARGNKTAALCCRGDIWGVDQLDFGWPASLSKTGPFWTNRRCHKEFKRIMGFLNQTTKAEWLQQVSTLTPRVLDYNANNTLVKRKLGMLLRSSQQ